MSYPVGTRIKLIQDDGLFPKGTILERTEVEAYRCRREGRTTEGWRTVLLTDEGVGMAQYLPRYSAADETYTFHYTVREDMAGVAFEVFEGFIAGDKVYIKEESPFFGSDPTHNPRDVEGTVMTVSEETYIGSMNITVDWGTGANNYRLSDLELSSLRNARHKERELMKGFSARKAVKDAIDALNSKPFVNHTRYVVVSADPKWASSVEHGACHAAVNRHPAPKKLCIISSLKREGIEARCCKPENIRMYYDWLLNRSPLRSAYLSKNVDKVLEQGYIIVSCGVAANLMQAANVALRQPWENHAPLVDMFGELSSQGMNENLAFIVSHYFSPDRTNPQILAYPGGAHRVFDWRQASNDSVVNFINDKLGQRTEKYRTNSSFSGADLLISDGGSFRLDHMLGKFQPPKSQSRQVAHVFAAAKTDGNVNAINLTTRVQWLLEHAIEIEKGIAA